MAANVFGTPITHLTLKAMDEYKDKSIITRKDLAIVAFEKKNVDEKDVRARQFVEDRRKSYGFECNLCLIYNATGDAIKLETYADVGGYVSPSSYPVIIGNGQWGAYLKREGGAIVYTVRNANAYEFQAVFVYYNLEPGRCYTEIRQAGYYKIGDPWSNYQAPLTANPVYYSQAHDNGISTFATIGGSTKSPVFEAIITLKGAWSRYTAQSTPGMARNLLLTAQFNTNDDDDDADDQPTIAAEAVQDLQLS